METLAGVDHKYIEVADRIESLIEKRALKVGDKLLSVRALSKEQGISVSTAFQAYYFLESKGLIEARPQSGYYVKFSPQHTFDMPTCCEPADEALPVSIDEMISSVYHDLRSPKLTSFSLSAPHPSLLPSAKLNKSVMHSLRNSPDHCLNYEHIQGNELLRKQIARLSFNWGGSLSEDDVVVTAGCMEALSFCLRAVTKPGDAVATESPTFYGIFRVMQSLGLKVVEVPTDPVTGVDINYLNQAIPRFNIKACLFVCNFNNPIGSCVPDDKKKELVDMLARKEIPLIEDDIYGEMYFGKSRPKTCKTYDKKGLVLHCGSFSKSLAPGYRIGWTSPGRFKNEVIRLKRMNNISTNTLAQAAIAHFLQNGRYELHLRHLRKALHTQCLRYLQAITEFFPQETRITRPEGGFVLWVEMQHGDGYKLHKRALKHQIGIAPGQIFSSQGQFHNYFRLSYGLPWSDTVESGLKTLGQLM
ncbi:MAG TPA: PLP-dependent aminotransferase family protein, partial [Cyclobacteriaceae bacterium]|nr:PLP-dependent aminotransferase family protein [Cyclobacteriaceae bacterium]